MTPPTLATGRSAKLSRVVDADDTATAVGSGSVDVLATPRLLAWMERATCDAVDDVLSDAETTVGSTVQLAHMCPSNVGVRVEIVATVVSVDGRRIHFDVIASNEDGRQCGHAEITRVIVDRGRFAG
jgi:predicted thioesterase